MNFPKFASNLFKASDDIAKHKLNIAKYLPNWSMSKVENSWKDPLISVAEISNFSKSCSKKQSKVGFCDESCSKGSRKNENFLV